MPTTYPLTHVIVEDETGLDKDVQVSKWLCWHRESEPSNRLITVLRKSSATRSLNYYELNIIAVLHSRSL